MFSKSKADMSIVLHYIVTLGHLPKHDLRLLLLRNAFVSRSAATTKSGRSSSRKAFIAHKALRRSRPNAGRKASASASWTGASEVTSDLRQTSSTL